MSSAFLSSLFPGVVSGCIYALIGVGFILIRKTSGVFNLAQGQIVIFGAYLFYMVVVTLGIHLWSAVAIVICIGAMIGILIERFLMRPLYGHDLGAAILVTLMAALFIEALLSMGWGTAFLVAPRMFPKEVALSVGSATISYDQLAVVLVTIVIFAVLGLIFFEIEAWHSNDGGERGPSCGAGAGRQGLATCWYQLGARVRARIPWWHLDYQHQWHQLHDGGDRNQSDRRGNYRWL